MKWQGMDSAPRDRKILLAYPGKICTVGWFKTDEYAKNPRPYWASEREHLFGVTWARKTSPVCWCEIEYPDGM